MPSGSRLVASRCTRGQRRTIASAVLAQPPIRCSQLSTTISTSCGARASSSASSAGRPGWAASRSASRDGRRHRVLVGDRGQLRQPHPVPGPVQQLGGHLQPQPGLAAPAGPGQGDQARGLHQRPDLGDLPVPADERRQLGGQIVRQRRVAQRPQRREPRLQARRLQLEDPFRAAQVLQPVDCPDRPAPRPAAARPAPAPPPPPTPAPAPRTRPRPPGRPGAPPGPPGRWPSAPPPRNGCPSAPAPAPRPARHAPAMACCICQHRRHARPRRGEHREERIPLRVHLAAVVRGQRRPDQRVMPGQHLRVNVVPQPPEQRRRALNVGEQEREGLHPSQRRRPARRRQLPAGTPSRQTRPPGWPPAADRLAGHPHGGHRSLTPRDARTGNSGRACCQAP